MTKKIPYDELKILYENTRRQYESLEKGFGEVYEAQAKGIEMRDAEIKELKVRLKEVFSLLNYMMNIYDGDIFITNENKARCIWCMEEYPIDSDTAYPRRCDAPECPVVKARAFIETYEEEAGSD